MGTIKLILVLALLGGLVYLGAEMIPPYFANYEFQDSLESEARLGTYSVKGDDVIRDAVFKRAQELEIPVTKEQIKVQRTGRRAAALCSLKPSTRSTSICPGYPMDLNFHPQSKNKTLSRSPSATPRFQP